MATQTTRLPQQVNVKLPSIALLTSKNDFDNWFELAKATLETKRMQNLINNSLPRPPVHDLDYDRWEMASKLVTFWLLSHLGGEIINDIELSGKSYEFADDFMQVLRLVIKGFHPLLEATRHSWSDKKAVDQDTTCKKTEKNIQETQPLKKSIRNAPGKGENIERHVITLRNRQSKDDNCAYCSRSGHEPSTCYYLVNNPPKNWRPDRNLWVYSLAKRRLQRMKRRPVSQLPPPPQTDESQETTIPSFNMASGANDNPEFNCLHASFTLLEKTEHDSQYEKEEKMVVETTDIHIEQESAFGQSAVQDITSNRISDPGSATQTVEIKRSQDRTFWEDNSFGSTGREENPVSIPKKPAVHAQYGSKEKYQRPIEDRPIRRHDRFLQSLEDVNLETLFDFTDIANTQGCIQTLSAETAYPTPIATGSHIADEILDSPELEDAYESTGKLSPNILATEVQPSRPDLMPTFIPPTELHPPKARVSARWTNGIKFPPPRHEEEQAMQVADMRQKCYGINMRFRKRRKREKTSKENLYLVILDSGLLGRGCVESLGA